MSKKIVFALSLFVLLCSSLYVRFNSLQAKCSNGYAVAPLFTLTDIEGNIVALENLTGKIVVLDFFYPQCQYSDDQIVHLEEIYEKYTRDELEIISISPKEIPIQDLEEFKTGPNRFSDLEYEISWIIARDTETQNVTAKYNILGYPTTVIIDQDGCIRYRHEGLAEESVLRPEIESLLPKTVYVDDDNVAGPWNGTKEHPFQNITSGMEHASDNDIVFVQNGTYYEHVVVDKAVSLIGENKHTTIIDGSGKTVVSLKVNNTKIKGFTVQDGPNGILMFPWTHGHIISSNIVLNNEYGIAGHYDCASVIICDNIITLNNITGIEMLFSHSVISNNLISDNGRGEFQEYSSGIQIVKGVNSKVVYCVNNTIFGNTIKNHRVGIWAIQYSEENLFFHNNFINNTRQVDGTMSNDTWDDSYPSGGNYWSDYNGADLHSGSGQNETGSDGIGDTAYVIDANNTDNYPLMGMFSDFNVTSGFHVQTICNSTISDFQFNDTAISFNASGEEETLGFCRICVPHALLEPPYTVLVNNETPLYINGSIFDNGTHRWIYFSYEHSRLEIVIVPEFPSFLIMPLFMTATLLAVIVYKRKHPL